MYCRSLQARPASRAARNSPSGSEKRSPWPGPSEAPGMAPPAEEHVFRNLRQLAQGCTAFIISHRLSTVRSADCIYFLKSGRIIEWAPHDELIKRTNAYARLSQVQHYRYIPIPGILQPALALLFVSVQPSENLTPAACQEKASLR
jgi:hypothetical protein